MKLVMNGNTTQVSHFISPTVTLKFAFATARSAVKKAAAVAKLKWLEKQAELVNNMKLHPKQA